MTDAMHIPALGLLSRTLQLLFGMLVSGEIEVTLLPSCATSFQNVLEVEKAVAEYLKERFPRCSEGIINDYVILMGKSTAKSNAEYLVINRDFLIQLKVGEEEGSVVEVEMDEKRLRRCCIGAGLLPEEGAMFMQQYKAMEQMIGKMGKSPLLRGRRGRRGEE